MALLGERLLEILVAMLITGVLFVAYYGITSGSWDYGMVLIVPFSFMLSMTLAAMAAGNLGMALFLVLLCAVILAVYLISRFARTRWLRLTLITSTFFVQVSAMVVLTAVLQQAPA